MPVRYGDDRGHQDAVKGAEDGRRDAALIGPVAERLQIASAGAAGCRTDRGRAASSTAVETREAESINGVLPPYPAWA